MPVAIDYYCCCAAVSLPGQNPGFLCLAEVAFGNLGEVLRKMGKSIFLGWKCELTLRLQCTHWGSICVLPLAPHHSLGLPAQPLPTPQAPGHVTPEQPSQSWAFFSWLWMLGSTERTKSNPRCHKVGVSESAWCLPSAVRCWESARRPGTCVALAGFRYLSPDPGHFLLWGVGAHGDGRRRDWTGKGLWEMTQHGEGAQATDTSVKRHAFEYPLNWGTKSVASR